MTTLAYKSGILAFDSKVTADGLCSGTMTKGRVTKKYLVAACGAAEDVEAFLDWMDAGGIQDDKKKFGLEREVDISAISVDKKGIVRHYGGRLYPYKIQASFHADGSGGHLAIGAMAHGATAVQAVKIASTYDSYTGGKVNTLSFP